MDDQPTVETISRLRLAPGDVLVLRTPHTLTAMQAREINRRMGEVLERAALGFEVPVVVLDSGLDLAVLAPQATA